MLGIWGGVKGGGRLDKLVSNSQNCRSKGTMLHLRNHTQVISLASGSDLDNVLVQAVIANYHRLGGLNNKHLFRTVLEATKSKIKMLADLVLIRTHFLVCRWPSSSCFITWQRAEREEASSLVPLLIRARIPFMRAPPS